MPIVRTIGVGILEPIGQGLAFPLGERLDESQSLFQDQVTVSLVFHRQKYLG